METGRRTQEGRCISPMSRIREEEGKVVVQLEVPGVKKDDVNVSIEDDQLQVFAARHDEGVDGNYLIRERNCGSYEKYFTIDKSIDRNSINASMENGVLTITLQFKEEVKPRKIEVKG